MLTKILLTQNVHIGSLTIFFNSVTHALSNSIRLFLEIVKIMDRSENQILQELILSKELFKIIKSAITLKKHMTVCNKVITNSVNMFMHFLSM